jgi:hypothetical protein
MAARNQADLWRDLVDEAGDDASVRAGQVTTEQAERELAAEGFDVAKERARADAHLRALEAAETQVGGDAPRPSEEQAWVARIPPTPVRARATSARWVWLVAATLAVATVGGLLYSLAHRPKPVDLPHEAPTVKAPPMPGPAPSGDVPQVAPREKPPAMGPKPH